MEKRYLSGMVEMAFPVGSTQRKQAEETRTISFVISSDAKDRHKSRVNMNNWKLDNYSLNPIVGYQHNVYGDNMCVAPSPDDVIGSSRVYFEEVDGRMLMKADLRFDRAEVNPTAEKIFQKVLDGTLRAASVGFLEIGKGKTEVEKDASGKVIGETYNFDGQELLEWSVVNIPSNPEAARRSIRNHAEAGVNFLRKIGLDVSVIRQTVNDLLDKIEKEDKPEETPGPIETPILNTKRDFIQQRKNEKTQRTA
jgi:hypothetical protein